MDVLVNIALCGLTEATLTKPSTAGLRVLGKGQSRIVYVYENDTVLKVARDESGQIQNGMECRLNKRMRVSILSPVMYCAKDFSWLIMARAKPMTMARFDALVGLTFKAFSFFTDFWKDRDLYDADFEAYADTIGEDRIGADWLVIYEVLTTRRGPLYRFLMEVGRLIDEADLAVGDLQKITSWGDVQGHPVLIDYGATTEFVEKNLI